MAVLITVLVFGLIVFLAFTPYFVRRGHRVAREWEATGGKYRTGFWMGALLTGPTTRFVLWVRNRRRAKSGNAS